MNKKLAQSRNLSVGQWKKKKVGEQQKKNRINAYGKKVIKNLSGNGFNLD